MEHTCRVTKVIYATGFFTLISIGLSCSTENPNLVVRTEFGRVMGFPNEGQTVVAFKGIPYAAPPVGDLRWKEPQPATSWTDVKKCDSFGPNAMQRKIESLGVWTKEFFVPVDAPRSEDCLYLNVWTATGFKNDTRPVMVYIHGGGFDQGSGSISLYNGESLAEKEIVFVTTNYRLGVFGFLAHPELTEESPHNTSGNYAILDQIAALKWVKNNIAGFGGDPDNVTIAGQSAGSMSVNLLAASPLAKGLFHKIIAQSGAMVLPGFFGGNTTLEMAEARGVEFAETVHANSLSELRQVPADSLLSADIRMPKFIIDGYVIPEPLPGIFAQCKQAIVPLLTGYNLDDLVFSPETTLKTYLQGLDEQFGDEADEVLQMYPATNNSEAEDAQKNLIRDVSFGIQNYAWARIQSENCNSPAYLYFFERKIPEKDGSSKGAIHSGEIAYAYDNLRFLNRPWEPADHELAKLMSSYWVNFATNGNPNGPDLPEWPSFNKDKGMVMDFNLRSEATIHPFKLALEYHYIRSKNAINNARNQD